MSAMATPLTTPRALPRQCTWGARSSFARRAGATTALPVVRRRAVQHAATAAAAGRHASAYVIAIDEEAPVDTKTPPTPPATGSGPAALTSKGLGVERNQTLPPVPPEHVHWVCDVDGIDRMRRAVFDNNPTTREGYPPIVGLDGEWKPGARTPVSILQVATRTDAFVVDLFAAGLPPLPGVSLVIHGPSYWVSSTGCVLTHNNNVVKSANPTSRLRRRTPPRAKPSTRSSATCCSPKRCTSSGFPLVGSCTS
jgi:hypothetical protein